MTDEELKEIFGDKITILHMNPGKVVLCDLCNKDYTESEQKGGFLFNSTAVCPDCQDEFLASVKRFHEEEYIRAYATPDESFRDFVYRIRGE